MKGCVLLAVNLRCDEAKLAEDARIVAQLQGRSLSALMREMLQIVTSEPATRREIDAFRASQARLAGKVTPIQAKGRRSA